MYPRKIGILGGTFDPPHLAHLIIAQEVLENLRLDQIWFIPCYMPPHKKNDSVSGPVHRIRMLKLALAGHDRFRICEIEIKRKGISFTVDTLRELSLLKPEKRLYLILGSDNLKLLPSWKEPEEIFRLAQVVVVRRSEFGYSKGDRWISKAVCVEVPRLEISSSQIRQKVKSGRSISSWVPEKVWRYIERHKLYRR